MNAEGYQFPFQQRRLTFCDLLILELGMLILELGMALFCFGCVSTIITRNGNINRKTDKPQSG